MHLISDCISLKILNDNNILGGIGNEIHLFKKDGCSKLPFKLKGKVHGIEFEEYSDIIIIYGENEFILLRKEKLLYRGSLSDWIISAKVLQEESSFLLVTAHSVALLFKYDEANKCCKICEKVSCTDKSTLYCSYIHGINWEDCVVFGGNAFGELLVWQPTITSCDGTSKAELLHRIPCHNGVIFSIDVNIDSKLLVTTSDDRSVRFWDIAFSEGANFSKAVITPRKSGYSHVARVFKGKIIHEDGKVYVLTGGEDSFICLWNQNGELLFKRRQHFGATIWSLDYHSPSKTVFTAGSSGNIFKYGLQDCFSKTESTLSVLESKSLDTNEYIAKVKFLNEKNFVGITNRNRLMHRIGFQDADWVPAQSFVPCKCTVLEVYEGFIAIAGYQKVTLYKFTKVSSSFEKMFDQIVLPGVIRSFIFLSCSEFLVSDESGNCKLVRSNNLEDSLSIDLPQSKERWITAACMIEPGFLIMSNRQGCLMLFVLSEDKKNSTLCHTLKRLHGHMGCTTVTHMKDSTSFCFLKTTGHDYTVRTIKLDKQKKQLAVLSREVIPIAWVEKVVPNIKNNNDLLFGFNDNHFVLWSREVDLHFEIPCGGGHRCWDLHLQLPNNLASMVFIKNKQVLLHEQLIFNKSSMMVDLPRNEWHVKPCNVMKSVNGLHPLLISGGDDNLLKISQFDSNNSSLTQLHVIYSHISSIRGLCAVWVESSGNYFIFSCGGRAQICVTAFQPHTGVIEEIVDYTILKDTKSQDIRCDPETRVMSIDVRLLCDGNFEIFVGCSDGYVRKLSMTNNSEITHVSEVYYGKCVLHVRTANDYLISIGTDGVLCFWKLSTWEQVFNVSHHESGVNSFDVRIVNDREFHLVSGGDDQQVVYSKVLHDGSTFKLSTLHRMDNLHTAQVTAVKFTPCLRYFYSSSVDQVVRKVDLETFSQCWDAFSCVADVKGIELVNGSTRDIALIYGCGLQVIELEKVCS